MPLTSPDNIFYADGSTPLSVEAISAAEATSIQDALTNSRAIRSFKWDDSSARDDQIDMELGDQGLQKDTLQTWQYNGSGWILVGPLYTLLYKGSNQTLTTAGTAYALTWDVESSDKWTMHDNTTNTNRIVVPLAGLYRLTCRVHVNSASGLSILSARVNGSTAVRGIYNQVSASALAGSPLFISGLVPLAAADYIEIMATPGASASVAVGGTGNNTSSVSLEYVGGI